jgi:CRP/FNR family cyclic AMP-dependent transcriptional regulator
MALSADERLAWLSRVAIFKGCAEASLLRVAEATAEVDFPAGRFIVEQGQVGNGLFILLSGTARVVRGDDVLARLGPGESFGELSVIDQQPRVASVIAIDPCTCLALASWDLLVVLESDPRLAINLLGALARRIRLLDDRPSH